MRSGGRPRRPQRRKIPGNHIVKARLRNLGRNSRVSVPDWTAFVLQNMARRGERISAGRGSSEVSQALHSVVLKNLPACAAKSFPVLLEALLDGIVTISHLLSAKPRRIVRASLLLLRRAGLRSRRAISQNHDGNCYQSDSAHLLLLRDIICDQPIPRRMTAHHDLRQARQQALVTRPMRRG